LKKNEEKKYTEKNHHHCGWGPGEICSALHGPGIAPVLHPGNTGATEGKDCGLNSPEKNDEKDAQFHERKSPELE